MVATIASHELPSDDNALETMPDLASQNVQGN